MAVTPGTRLLTQGEGAGPERSESGCSHLEGCVPDSRDAWLTHDDSVKVSDIDIQRFRGGLVFKAHRLFYHPTLGSRVLKKKKQSRGGRRHGRHHRTLPRSEGLIFFFFFTLVTGPRRSLSLKLSDTHVYERDFRPAGCHLG